MGKKGENKTEKRLASSKVKDLKRKEAKFSIRSRAGGHKGEKSVPLGFVVRDLLGVAKTAKEAKRIINKGMVKIDGIIRKDYKFAVGLFDSVNLPKTKKSYRVIYDSLGRIQVKEINEKNSSNKICKVVGKRKTKKGKIQLTTHDGRNILEKESKIRVGDSIKIRLPSQKIESVLELKKGNLGYLVGGSNIGKIAKIVEIEPGTIKRPRLVKLEKESKFQSVETNVFVVGEKKPLIELSEEK